MLSADRLIRIFAASFCVREAGSGRLIAFYYQSSSFSAPSSFIADRTDVERLGKNINSNNYKKVQVRARAIAHLRSPAAVCTVTFPLMTACDGSALKAHRNMHVVLQIGG